MTESATTDNGLDTVSIWPVTFRYSVILGVVYGAYSILLYATGLAVNTGPGLLSMLIYIVLLVLALRSFRTRNAGFMTFGQGFSIGFLVSILSNFIGAMMSYIYLAFIDDSILEQMTQKAVEAMAANPSMNSETLEMMTGIYEMLYSPGGLLVFGICSGIFLGFFAALILALILKKARPIQ